GARRDRAARGQADLACAEVGAGARAARAPDQEHRSARATKTGRSSLARRAVRAVRARAARVAGHGGAQRVRLAPDRVRARLFHRLAGGVERHSRVAHPADERDQRHQRHHLGRRYAANFRADLLARHAAQRGRGALGHDQYQRRLLGHHAHAAHVPTVIVMPESLTTIAYLVAGVLFILSLGGLSTQKTARRGNAFGIAGMLLALGVTAIGHVHSYGALAAAVALGSLVGAVLAMRVEMTSMPELVAVLHSFVGLAAVLVGIASYL